jgi:hypothetical protein
MCEVFAFPRCLSFTLTQQQTIMRMCEMALSELAAVEAAYQVLIPLDAAGRRRALQWLSDALATEGPLPESTPAAAEAGENLGTRRVPAAKPASTGTPRRRTSTSAAAAQTTPSRTRRVRAAKQTPAPAESQGRAYRRMPPAEEVMAAYEQVGSVSGVAEHFAVPRHTAQGWARQLRKQGHVIGRAN